MIRSLWKVKVLPRDNALLPSATNKQVKIFNCNFMIVFDFIGFTFFVYNGHKFQKIMIYADLVGVLLSTLVITRFNNGDGDIHDKEKKKKRKKRKNK